jgi:hypothetical protein
MSTESSDWRQLEPRAHTGDPPIPRGDRTAASGASPCEIRCSASAVHEPSRLRSVIHRKTSNQILSVRHATGLPEQSFVSWRETGYVQAELPGDACAAVGHSVAFEATAAINVVVGRAHRYQAWQPLDGRCGARMPARALGERSVGGGQKSVNVCWRAGWDEATGLLGVANDVPGFVKR